MKNGKYKAKLTAYGIQESSNGDPQVTAKFVISDGEFATEDLYWTGSLKSAQNPGSKSARDITFEALEVMGFDFHKNNSLAALADGPASHALDTEKEYLLVVEMETYQGKTRARVKFINDLFGAKFKNALTKDAFATKSVGLGLEASIAQFRQGRAAPAARQTNAPAGEKPLGLDDLPF